MSAPKKIAVAGATGRVGRHRRGHPRGPRATRSWRSRARAASTSSPARAWPRRWPASQVIVDAATGPSPDEQAATEFFTTAARNLQEAGERAGVERIVVVSIIGSDRFTGGYGAAKVAHEQAHAVGPDPGARAARRAVPRVRRAAHGVGRARRRDLRAEDAHAAGRRPDRRRGARRPGHRLERGGVDAGADPRDRRPARGEPRRDGDAARGPARRRGADRGARATRPTPTRACSRRAGCCPARTPSSPARRSRSGSTRRPEHYASQRAERLAEALQRAGDPRQRDRVVGAERLPALPRRCPRRAGSSPSGSAARAGSSPNASPSSTATSWRSSSSSASCAPVLTPCAASAGRSGSRSG